MIPINQTVTVLFLIAIIGIVAFFGLVWELPRRMVEPLPSTVNRQDRLKLENDIRGTWAQIVGGMVVILGVFFTWQQSLDTQKSLQVSQDNELTSRFTAAIGQLSNTSMDVRLGGIYGLARLGADSPDDYWTVMETLSAFVRASYPFDPSAVAITSTTVLTTGWRRSWSTTLDPRAKARYSPGAHPVPACSMPPALPPLAIDAQAALTSLARRHLPAPPGSMAEGGTLDLQNANLHRMFLRPLQGQLEGVNFTGVNLQEANLDGDSSHSVDLQNATLFQASLICTQLHYIDLQGANLTRAELQRAFLDHADLSGANLYKAHLEDANLNWATLSGTRFRFAYLDNALLKDADLRENDPVLGADLSYAHARYALLRRAHLAGADFRQTDLTGADLTGAQGTPLDASTAIYRHTICPDKTSSDNDGKTCVGHFR